MFWCFYCWLRISKCRIGCNDLISWILANDNALTPTILSVEFMSLLSFTCQAWPSWKSRLHGFLTLLCCSCSVTLIIIFLMLIGPPKIKFLVWDYMLYVLLKKSVFREIMVRIFLIVLLYFLEFCMVIIQNVSDLYQRKCQTLSVLNFLQFVDYHCSCCFCFG